MRRRGHVIPLRLNEREYRHLCEQVKISGFSREEYLRSLILGKEIHPRPCTHHAELVRQISGLCNNANQLAHRANSTGVAGQQKDEVLDQYNNIVQSAGSIALTGNSSLQGTKEKGIDDYTGSYTANYEDFSDTEYLFGGTSIKREAGKDLSIDCALEVTDGTAKVFWISGADEAVTLLETTGIYSDTITLPEGGNYIGIECENFTGSIELNME